MKNMDKFAWMKVVTDDISKSYLRIYRMVMAMGTQHRMVFVGNSLPDET